MHCPCRSYRKSCISVWLPILYYCPFVAGFINLAMYSTACMYECAKKVRLYACIDCWSWDFLRKAKNWSICAGLTSPPHFLLTLMPAMWYMGLFCPKCIVEGRERPVAYFSTARVLLHYINSLPTYTYIELLPCPPAYMHYLRFYMDVRTLSSHDLKRKLIFLNPSLCVTTSSATPI